MIETQRKAFLQHLLSAAESSDLLPDIGIDYSLVKYSGLNSAAELENSITQVIKDMCSRIPDYVQCLGSALAAFKNIPNAVGLGALALSIALELTISVAGEERESHDSTLYMMQRVFAEEKASGVRDLIEEYLKRLRMYFHQPTRVLMETERLEKQLSEQLTRLKNSMLHDNQMSSRSLKHWTNGAAFHLQMLIHAARLKMQSTSEHKEQLQFHQTSIISVLDCYQFDLEQLLDKYKAYKKSTIKISHPARWVALLHPLLILTTHHLWEVQDKELNRKSPTLSFNIFSVLPYFSSCVYVDYMFDNWAQIKELKSYFGDLKNKTMDLILQNSEFNIQKVQFV
ncbi:hypothetical protein C0J50_6935 [Silurus asotus]|uniref:Uncharacterized protein n=1 Tax=Silurus asotus TaxID=30991 RepID=A0AAD5A1W4_SILAS|nr:hypothetical protein C0J50_6935 [Silurus asotus]